MSAPAKCPTCGRRTRTATTKAIGFFIMIGGIGAQSWAFFLVKPLPLRIWFATVVGVALVAALAKFADSDD